MTGLFQNVVLRVLATPLLAGAVLAVLAPFGTDGFSVPVRFLYWIGLTLAGGLGAILGQVLLARFRPNAALPLRIIVQSVTATLAVAPFVSALHPQNTLMGLGLTLFYIFVIAGTITLVGELAHRPAPAEPNIRPALLDRLPPKFREATLYAISSEDHYVRIHSAAGEHMLLMRLSDAQDLAAPLPGLKPHRSWWVAEAGVAEVSRTSGKASIVLHSGTQVPISRSGAKALKTAGWT
jgi:hypothetical protein